MTVFRFARFFNPSSAATLSPVELEAALNALPITFASLPQKALLRQEFRTLRAMLIGANVEDTPDAVWRWWMQRGTTLPTWYEFAIKLAVVQPSNASSERVFSLLNGLFSDRQQNALDDMINLSVMLRYNAPWIRKMNH